jgi:eukaryotic-like serine/threonine-protein kinase
VTGKRLYSLDITDGKERWAAENPRPPGGVPVSWGPPTIHGAYLYAAVLGLPLRFGIRDGSRGDWGVEGLFECDPPSPLVVQGHGFWSVAVNKTGGGINVLDQTKALNLSSWVFPIIKNTDAYWLVADANRVFLLDGNSLSALPVF